MGGNAKREMYKGVSMGYSIITSSYMIVAIAGYWAFGFNVRPSFPGRIQMYSNILFTLICIGLLLREPSVSQQEGMSSMEYLTSHAPGHTRGAFSGVLST